VSSSGGQANGPSVDPSVSADGRSVAFSSDATNLVNDDSNETTDMFVRDLQTPVTTRVSVTSSGTQASGMGYSPSISADGQLVAFSSLAPDLVSDDPNGKWTVSSGIARRIRRCGRV
jgi:Tol biopolymer transport system component